MNTTQSALGQSKSWSILRKLGEGDAGEVFLVESLLDRKQAILKRPVKSSFSSDIIRQATQIESEGKILRALNGLRTILPRSAAIPRIDIRTPLLLDQSQPGTEFSERFFIVIEKASGFDLKYLARLALLKNLEPDEFSPEDQVFLMSITEKGTIPDLVMMQTLAGIIQMFSAIHGFSPNYQNGEKTGIVWNDVKPDHIFWDPRRSGLMVIDWGNAQFLEADGYNKDRRISKNNDYAQLIQSFGSFFAEINSNLPGELKWPATTNSILSLSDAIRPIQSRVHELLKEQSQKLLVARELETDLIRSMHPELAEINRLLESQQTILELGELPDFAGAEHFCTQLASRLILEGKLTEFDEFCQMTSQMHSTNPIKWEALIDIASVAGSEGPASHPIFLQAISSALIDDWPSALWSLLSATADDPEPAWWDEICNLIRQTGLGIGPESLPPLIILRRNVLLMQAELLKLRDQHADSLSDESKVQALEAIIKLLREEVTVKWEEVEPNPPDSGLQYADIDRLCGAIGDFSPEAERAISKALEQPKAELKIILEAWEKQDYDSARRGLRRLLLWDPDRRRVLMADRGIARTQKWLEKIRQGPQNGQQMLDFVTGLEFTGREIRNQVAPAVWLDVILDALTQLRKGRKVAELLVEYPELSRSMSWLEGLEPRRYVPEQSIRQISFERIVASQKPEPTIRGLHEGQLGPGGEVVLADPLDTWAPEARGSSARTFVGFLRAANGQLKQVAVKIMRGDRLEYALPLYREEVQVLNMLRDVPGVTPMLECGFIYLANGDQLPPDNRPINARSLSGNIHRFGPDQTANFLSSLDTRAHQGWLPYLVMPKLDNLENLMWRCDAGYTRGQFLPIEESLRMAVQICDILQIAHERNIVYRDHKLLHYYWLPLYNGVFMIDWNVARFHPEGLSPAELQFDLVQLGARALHHIFTGRVAPGALADGPNRVEEIEAAANSYRAQWTYDDQRLPPALKTVIETLLSGGYKKISQLRESLNQVYLDLVAENETEQTKTE